MSIKAIDISKATTLNTNVKSKKAQKKQQKDILHDSPVRYVGYCDDIGATTKVICSKSQNAFVKSIPVLSYIPVAAYVGADVVHTFKQAKKTDDTKTASKKAFAQFVFQAITSVLAPVALVAATQKLGGKAFDKFVPALREQVAKDGSKIANRTRDIALALTGLGSLIALSKPIDNVCEKVVMEKGVNRVLGLDETKKENTSSKLRTTQA